MKQYQFDVSSNKLNKQIKINASLENALFKKKIDKPKPLSILILNVLFIIICMFFYHRTHISTYCVIFDR